MSRLVEMAVWLDRETDPNTPTADRLAAFAEAFTDATTLEFVQATLLAVQAVSDRIDGARAEIAEITGGAR